MRLSSSIYEVDEPSVAVHSIADVCHVECPDGSTCFFDYNANAFACNAIIAAVGEEGLDKEEEEEEEEEEEGEETSSEWPIADVPSSTTARLNMPVSTIVVDEEDLEEDEEEETSTSTSTSTSTAGQVFDVPSEQSERTEASTEDDGQGQDGTTTSERTGILPDSAGDDELSVVDIFPESGGEDDSSVDAVTLAMPETTTMPTSTMSGVSSTTVDPSPTDISSPPESTDQPTEESMSVKETTPKQTVEVDPSPAAHDSDRVSDADAPETGVDSPTVVNAVSVESSTLSLLNGTDVENETQLPFEEGATATVAGFVPVPVETEGPLMTDGSVEEVTTGSPMTTPNPIESVQSLGDAQDAETTEETIAAKEVVTRGPETDFTTVAEPGFVITAGSVEDDQTEQPDVTGQTEQPDVSTLRSLIETTAESESYSGMFEGVTQGFESVHAESEAITEAQHRAEMTTRLSKVLTTTLQSITESILRHKNSTDDGAMEFEDALTKALTDISTSTSTSTTTTTEQTVTSEEGSSVDLSIPIIKDPAEVEQKLQELVANVTKLFRVTTQAYDDGAAAAAAAGVTESSISAFDEAVTKLVPGFVSTVATTEDPEPATAVVMGGAVEEDKLADATPTDNAPVPRNLQLDESEELHNALVTEGPYALANECEALGMSSCDNGCIRREKRCDLIMDCEDGSDEINCGE